MMTVFWISFLTWTSFFFLAFSSSPLFMAVNLMMAAIFGLVLTTLMCVLSWYPLILGMLFLGGILVTFMILCSLMPNESMAKSNFNWVVLFFSLPLLSFSMFASEAVYKTSKTCIEETPSFSLIMGVMLLYFFGFIMAISEQNHPMRTLWCLQNSGFVSL